MATVEELAPPLTAGDCLSRGEFLRRWEAHTEIKKAELIGGIVYIPSPVAVDHGDTEGNVGTWIGVYRAATPGTASGHNTTSFLLEDCPQADVNLRILPECGGASWVEGNYRHGAPELFAKVCRSSAAYDLHQKLELYQDAGVQEYLAILLFEKEIRWHSLVEDEYELLSPGADSIWRSGVFPGLWLDGQALLAGNLSKVLATLQIGLNTPEHKAFVETLAARKAKSGR
jgi:Uma2 family endonuclease